MRIFLLLGLAAGCAFAQPVSIGVKAGIPISDVLESPNSLNPFGSFYSPQNHPYVVGGTVQFNFPLRFSIEVDGLYRRAGYNHAQFTGTSTPQTTQTTANFWEFPVLGKYAILGGPIRPFVAAGANFRHVSDDQTGGVSSGVPELLHDFTEGFTFGAGLEFKFGKLRITPEARYTRWGSESFSDPVHALLTTNRNQGDFMLGLTF